MKYLLYSILGIKLFLLALLPASMFVMPAMEDMPAVDTNVMACMHGDCEQPAATDSASCLDHCINTLKTDVSLPVYQGLPLLVLFVAVAAAVVFIIPVAIASHVVWARASIGKLLQRTLLRTVILRD